MCARKKVPSGVWTLVSWLVVLPIVHASASTEAAAQAQGNRDDSDEQAIPTSCVTCHGIDIIRAQRLSAAAWLRELDKMIAWGAAVDSSEKEQIVKLLEAKIGRAHV